MRMVVTFILMLTFIDEKIVSSVLLRCDLSQSSEKVIPFFSCGLFRMALQNPERSPFAGLALEDETDRVVVL